MYRQVSSLGGVKRMALSQVLLYSRGEPTVDVWLVELMCRFLAIIFGGCEWSVAGKEAGV